MSVLRSEYRRLVGPPQYYDLAAAMQFTALVHIGLRETHTVLDIGCGSLRLGRLLIPFLEAGNYCGIEPNKALVAAGIEYEVSPQVAEARRPRFVYNESFDASSFSSRFDFIVATSVLSHAPRAEVVRCFQAIRRFLNEATGMAIVTMHEGDTDYEGLDWVRFARYRRETIALIAHMAGLRCFELSWSPHTGQVWVGLVPDSRRRIRIMQLNFRGFLSDTSDVS